MRRWVWIIVGFWLCTPIICSAGWYKYQDENGVWHYTDSMTSDVPVDKRQKVQKVADPDDYLTPAQRKEKRLAAFHDPRFSPLSDQELEQVTIEVSVLSEPEPLTFQDGEDLLTKLRANVDGVIIRKGRASATFLPQVWEQLPRPEDFLSHLCAKAGLSSDAWKLSGLDVMTYQVQYFEEEE